VQRTGQHAAMRTGEKHHREERGNSDQCQRDDEREGGQGEAHSFRSGLTFELTCGRQTAQPAGERQVERRVRQQPWHRGLSA